MPRDGAIVFGDLIGKFDMLRIECATQGVIQAPRLEPANLDALNTELAFPRLSANRTYHGIAKATRLTRMRHQSGRPSATTLRAP